MRRLKNYAILSLTIAVFVFPSTTSSQMPESPPESSSSRTSRSEQPQASPTPPTKFIKGKKKAIHNRYIVVLNDDVVSDDLPLEVRRARVTAIASRHAQTHGGKFDYVYETALKGYAIELPNEAAAIAISNLPEVKWVEEDAFGEFGSNDKSKPTKQEAVCRGKSVPVSLLEHPFGLKMYGRRTSYLSGGISQRARLVIRNRDEFNEVWNQIVGLVSNKPPLPKVDFSREMIIVAARGEQPTSGYEIIIDSACEVDNQLEVLVHSTKLLGCGLQLQVVTAPVDIVRLPKTDLPVVFRENEVTSDCN
jgi:PrcB C-terminal/Peptidase inhibitor I9